MPCTAQVQQCVLRMYQLGCRIQLACRVLCIRLHPRSTTRCDLKVSSKTKAWVVHAEHGQCQRVGNRWNWLAMVLSIFIWHLNHCGFAAHATLDQSSSCNAVPELFVAFILHVAGTNGAWGSQSVAQQWEAMWHNMAMVNVGQACKR